MAGRPVLSNDKEQESVRPRVDEEMEDVGDGEGGVAEEVVAPKVRKVVAEPTEQEVEEHNVDHAVFRSWCPHCVKGKGVSYGHRRVEEGSEEKQVP